MEDDDGSGLGRQQASVQILSSLGRCSRVKCLHGVENQL